MLPLVAAADVQLDPTLDAERLTELAQQAGQWLLREEIWMKLPIRKFGAANDAAGYWAALLLYEQDALKPGRTCTRCFAPASRDLCFGLLNWLDSDAYREQ